MLYHRHVRKLTRLFALPAEALAFLCSGSWQIDRSVDAGWVRHLAVSAVSFLKTHLPFLRPILASTGIIV